MASHGVTRTAKVQLASELLVALQALPDAVRSVVEALWNGAVSDGPVAARIREEAAALVALSGRDGLALQVELLRLLNDRTADFTSIAAVLWPLPRRYRIATVIYGARRLDDVDRLLPGAQQWPLTGPTPPTGIPHLELSALLGPVLADNERKMLLILPVDSPDAYTAVNTARRSMVETLDQYSAGQRLLELTIGRESVALGVDNRRVMTHSRSGGAKIARPLTVHWAEPVRPAMRMANLAGKMDAPVASVMLAWSALESLGVDADQGFELVAKACALQSIRQQVLSVFKSVTAAANAQINLAHQRVLWIRKPLGEAERALERVVVSNSPKAREALRNIEARLPELRTRHADAEDAADAIEQRMLPHIETVRRDLLGGGDPLHPLQTSSYTLDLNLFLDALLPLPVARSVDPAAAGRAALSALAAEAGGLAREQFLIWSARLADPVALAYWVNLQQNRFHGLLAWMYASRNLAIHTGEFTMPADVLTAQAARGIVDMVLEFLGYWYKDRNSLGLPDPAAIDIIRTLADRKDSLAGHLNTAVSCHPLNVAGITAPDSDCWNRPPRRPLLSA